MSGVRYGILRNDCEGHSQAVRHEEDGSEVFSAVFRGAGQHAQCMEAIRFCVKHGHFPSETPEEEEVKLCSHCGQPMPE